MLDFFLGERILVLSFLFVLFPQGFEPSPRRLILTFLASFFQVSLMVYSLAVVSCSGFFFVKLFLTSRSRSQGLLTGEVNPVVLFLFLRDVSRVVIYSWLIGVSSLSESIPGLAMKLSILELFSTKEEFNNLV